MKIEIKKIDEIHKEIKIEVEANEIKQKVKNYLLKEGKRFSIKGFREGKSPINLLMTHYGKFVEKQILEDIISEYSVKAILEHKVIPVTDFLFYIDLYEPEKNLIFILKIIEFPWIDVGECIGIEVPFSFSREITSLDEKKTLKKLQEENAFWEPKGGDETVEDGDQIISELKVILIDSKKEKIKNENFIFKVGSEKKYFPVDIQFRGKRVGEEVRFSHKVLTNEGKDYDYEEWSIKIKAIKRMVLPEINDEFAKDIGEFESVEELKKNIRENLKKELEKEKESKMEEALIDTINQKINVQIPSELFEIKKQDFIKTSSTFLKKNLIVTDLEGEELDEKTYKIVFDKIKEDIMNREDFEEMLRKNLLKEIILANIARKEGIRVEEDEIFQQISEILPDKVDISPFGMTLIEMNVRKKILFQKTMDILKRYARIKEV